MAIAVTGGQAKYIKNDYRHYSFLRDMCKPPWKKKTRGKVVEGEVVCPEL
jgi:hypothetical protein